MAGKQKPLIDGNDVSWLPWCKVGDCQGSYGACSIFALANWHEIMHEERVSDHACIEIWGDELHRQGRKTGGLSIEDAYAACRRFGLLKNTRGIERTTNLHDLHNQPLIGVYRYTAAWQLTWRGCLDHQAPSSKTEPGHHAVAIVASGRINSHPRRGDWIYVENSHGKGWGYFGLGIMNHELHEQLIVDMWRLKLK